MARQYAKKIDANQPEIVRKLRKVPGVKVLLDKDDILVGYKGRNYLYEIKQDPTSEVKPGQYKLLQEFKGHYMFAFCVEDILEDIGITKRTAHRTLFNAIWHALIRDGQTPAKANKWASRAVTRYKQNQFDSPQQLIVDMIEEGKA
ncbi:MAG: hypothetical protein JKX91_06420 [Rhizobiaceae bacterium]|nr:hypothetical protein [Rhizobiaceae bacterium]